MPTQTHTSIRDWHPDNPDNLSPEDGLSPWRAANWVPQFIAHCAGVWVEVGGVSRRRW